MAVKNELIKIINFRCFWFYTTQ